jgi:predicted GIY-YIG superfamily endonuclease
MIINRRKQIVYIGCTKSIRARTYCHKNRFGKSIRFVILQSTGKKKRALRLEIMYTKRYIKLGMPLQNEPKLTISAIAVN